MGLLVRTVPVRTVDSVPVLVPVLVLDPSSGALYRFHYVHQYDVAYSCASTMVQYLYCTGRNKALLLLVLVRVL